MMTACGAPGYGSLTGAKATAIMSPLPLAVPPSVAAPPCGCPVRKVPPSPRHLGMGPVCRASVLGLRDGQRGAQGKERRQGGQTENPASINDESSVHFAWRCQEPPSVSVLIPDRAMGI
jgi:hypothetical protein